MSVCDITSDGPARRPQSAATPLLPPSTSCISLPFSHSHQPHTFLLSICFCLFPFVFFFSFVYKCSVFMMNLSKWMSWRKRNFFGRKLKPPNTEMGKWIQRVLRRDSYYLLILQPVSEGSYHRTVDYACILVLTVFVKVMRLLMHPLESDATKINFVQIYM